MNYPVLALALFLALFSAVPVFASGSEELGHVLTTAGGISSPSVTTALGENPSGLIYNNSTKLNASLATGNNSFKPIGFGGGVFAGNGTVGGGIALLDYNSQGDNPGNILILQGGVAATIDSLNIAFGFSGTDTLSNSGATQGSGTGGDWSLDLGMIYNPKGPGRLGLVAYQVVGGTNALGAGYAYDISSNATLALDGAYAIQAKTTTLKPGLEVHVQSIQITSGYGFRAQGTGGDWLRTGFSLGVGFPVSDKVQLQGYYNQISYYYLAAVIKI